MRLPTAVFQGTTFIVSVFLLSACSWKNDTSQIKSDSGHWYCTPKAEDEWTCEESDAEYNRLAQKREDKLNQSAELSSEKSAEASEQDPVTKVAAAPFVIGKQNKPVTEPAKKDKKTVSQVKKTPSSSPATETLSQKEEFSRWVVQLAAYSNEDSAKRLVDEVPQSTYFKTQVKGAYYFTVVLIGFNTRAEAVAASQQSIVEKVGVTPWIRRGQALRQVLAE